MIREREKDRDRDRDRERETEREWEREMQKRAKRASRNKQKNVKQAWNIIELQWISERIVTSQKLIGSLLNRL